MKENHKQQENNKEVMDCKIKLWQLREFKCLIQQQQKGKKNNSIKILAEEEAGVNDWSRIQANLGRQLARDYSGTDQRVVHGIAFNVMKADVTFQ